MSTLSSLAEDIPIEENPNDPAIQGNAQERIRRQRALLQKKLKQRQQVIEEKQKEEQKITKETPPAQPAKPSPQPQAGKTTDTLKQATGKKSAAVEKQMAGQPYASIYLSPASVIVKTSESFATVVAIQNPQKVYYDSVEVFLKYPPQNLRPTAIHQYDLLSLLQGEPECAVDEQAGTIRYKAPFKEAINGLEKNLITIEWQTLAPAESVQIQPYLGKDFSAAYLGKKLQSETVFGVADALTGANVRIEGPRPPVPQGERFLTYSDEQLNPILAGTRNETKTPPTLWIDQPSSGILKTGQWVVIDVGIDNPNGVVFDEVRLAGRFDPKAVELVDSDRGNWIHAGLNVLDGPFHKAFPWTLFYTNRIVPSDGYFYYRMGTNRLRPQEDGTVIRIFAKIKKDTSAPILDWLWGNVKQADSPTTGLYLTGRDIYFETVQVKNQTLSERTFGVRVPDIDMIEKADPSAYRF